MTARQTRPRPDPLAVSYAEADTRLRKRSGTTAGLVAAGRLRAIPYGKRSRVLLADVERVAGEGFLPDLRRPRAPRRRPTTDDVSAAIMRIDIDALRDHRRPAGGEP